MKEGQVVIKQPIDVLSKDMSDNKFEYYRWLREYAPVCKAKAGFVNVYIVSRYDDCVMLLKDSLLGASKRAFHGAR